jgi:hypothetical protein
MRNSLLTCFWGSERAPAWPSLGLAALLAGAVPAHADQELDPLVRAVRATVTVPAENPGTRLDSLQALLELYERDRIVEIEARYDQNGNAGKRLLERRFGVIEHRFRVDADPRGIYRRWRDGARGEEDLVRALEEITEGRFTAYYFFDGVIRPNIFATEDLLSREESALHEKVHLIQPSVYRALGIDCFWLDRRDACVRSLEPVAVYLTEYALLKRQSPGRSDASINRAIERHLVREGERCGYGLPLPRCPAGDQATAYIVLPLDLAREVSRHGLEWGIRRFVAGLTSGPGMALAD